MTQAIEVSTMVAILQVSMRSCLLNLVQQGHDKYAAMQCATAKGCSVADRNDMLLHVVLTEHCVASSSCPVLCSTALFARQF